MDRNVQKIGLVNLAVLLLVGCAATLVSRYAQSAAGQIGALFLGLGWLIAAISYFQMRLAARERLEQLEFDELKKAGSGAALFTEAAETFPAQRAREQFERYFIPVFSVVLLLVQGLLCFLLWRWLGTVSPPPP